MKTKKNTKLTPRKITIANLRDIDMKEEPFIKRAVIRG
jgi:hypothetical protein